MSIKSLDKKEFLTVKTEIRHGFIVCLIIRNTDRSLIIKLICSLEIDVVILHIHIIRSFKKLGDNTKLHDKEG